MSFYLIHQTFCGLTHFGPYEVFEVTISYIDLFGFLNERPWWPPVACQIFDKQLLFCRSSLSIGTFDVEPKIQTFLTKNWDCQYLNFWTKFGFLVFEALTNTILMIFSDLWWTMVKIPGLKRPRSCFLFYIRV